MRAWRLAGVGALALGTLMWLLVHQRPPTEPVAAAPDAGRDPAGAYAWRTFRLNGAPIPLGTRLTIVGRTPDGQYDVQFAAAEGRVSADMVRLNAPTCTGLTEVAKHALLEGKLLRAREALIDALSLEARDRDALELALAVELALGHRAPAAALAETLRTLRRAPVQTEAQAPAPRAQPKRDEHWFVDATSLRLRSEPLAKARLIAELPAGTEVTVLAVEGGWARVSAQTGDPDAGVATIEGWVATAFLAPAPRSSQELRAEASLLAPTNPLQATTLLERAASRDADEQVLRDLVGAALAAHRYPVATRAALALSAIASDEVWTDIRFTAGCVGDRAVATWVSEADAVEELPEAFCAYDAPWTPCPPESVQGERTRRFERLRSGTVDSQALARVEIHNTRRREGQLFILGYPYTPADFLTCGSGYAARVEPPVVAATVPLPPPGQFATTWVELPGYDDHLYVVRIAADQEQALATVPTPDTVFGITSQGDSLREGLVRSVGWHAAVHAPDHPLTDACDAEILCHPEKMFESFPVSFVWLPQPGGPGYGDVGGADLTSAWDWAWATWGSVILNLDSEQEYRLDCNLDGYGAATLAGRYTRRATRGPSGERITLRLENGKGDWTVVADTQEDGKTELKEPVNIDLTVGPSAIRGRFAVERCRPYDDRVLFFDRESETDGSVSRRLWPGRPSP